MIFWERFGNVKNTQFQESGGNIKESYLSLSVGTEVSFQGFGIVFKTQRILEDSQGKLYYQLSQQQVIGKSCYQLIETEHKMLLSSKEISFNQQDGVYRAKYSETDSLSKWCVILWLPYTMRSEKMCFWISTLETQREWKFWLKYKSVVLK